jgi:hypothetical protein
MKEMNKEIKHSNVKKINLSTEKFNHLFYEVPSSNYSEIGQFFFLTKTIMILLRNMRTKDDKVSLSKIKLNKR